VRYQRGWSPRRYRLQLTMNEETHATLRRLQDLRRREIPSGDPAAIVDRTLRLLLRDVEKRKLAATAKPRKGPPFRNGRGPHGSEPAHA
jgi:hypothetical protein